jgi:hypothetical protein
MDSTATHQRLASPVYPRRLANVRNTSSGLTIWVLSMSGLIRVLETTAARLLRFLQALKANGRTYERNGHSEHIGNFVVDSFKPAVLTATPDNPSTPEWVLVAGCHRILWSEIESVSQQIFDAETAEIANNG